MQHGEWQGEQEQPQWQEVVGAAQLVLPSLKRLMIKFDGDADAGGCSMHRPDAVAGGCLAGCLLRGCWRADWPGATQRWVLGGAYPNRLLTWNTCCPSCLRVRLPACAGEWLRGAAGLEELSLYCSSLTLTCVLGSLTRVRFCGRGACGTKVEGTHAGLHQPLAVWPAISSPKGSWRDGLLFASASPANLLLP